MNKLLFLPDNYKRRDQPAYFNDVTKHVYQPEVYPFAETLSAWLQPASIASTIETSKTRSAFFDELVSREIIAAVAIKTNAIKAVSQKS